MMFFFTLLCFNKICNTTRYSLQFVIRKPTFRMLELVSEENGDSPKENICDAGILRQCLKNSCAADLKIFLVDCYNEAIIRTIKC